MKPFVSAVLALTLMAFASVNPVQAATSKEAGDYVETLGNKALAIISNSALGKDKKQASLETLFSANVDTAWVGRFVMGRFWRTATDDQKARYLKEYAKFLVQTYASRFTDYTSGSFKITNTRDDGDGEFLVSMEVSSGESGSEPILVDYRVRENGKTKFAVFDIIVEGVSMITTQRSEFASVIGSHDIDYLISQMASKAIAPPPIGGKDSAK